MSKVWLRNNRGCLTALTTACCFKSWSAEGMPMLLLCMGGLYFLKSLYLGNPLGTVQLVLHLYCTGVPGHPRPHGDRGLRILWSPCCWCWTGTASLIRFGEACYGVVEFGILRSRCSTFSTIRVHILSPQKSVSYSTGWFLFCTKDCLVGEWEVVNHIWSSPVDVRRIWPLLAGAGSQNQLVTPLESIFSLHPSVVIIPEPTT